MGETLIIGGRTFNNVAGFKATDDNETIQTYTKGGGGGGGASVRAKDVNFIDYDGTILHSYTKAEFAQLDSLPANPDHSGDEIPLTSQGWNWTKAQITAQLTAQPNDKVYVGQMYVTKDGKSYIIVEMQEGRLSPYMSLAVNGTVSVDWGDDSTPSTITGTSINSRINTQHVYAAAGCYKIAISVVSGSYAFFGTSTYTLLNKGSSSSNQNRVYSSCAKKVYIGNNAAISNYAFTNCYGLEIITIPSTVTGIPNSAFYYCYSLGSVTIPSDVTNIGTTTFSECYSLASISLPSGITSFGNYDFNNCFSLCYVMIPSGVTSIGNNVFYSCSSLANITIPSGVTSIGTSAFFNCYGFGKIRFLRSTPPTVDNSNVFTNIPTDCVISVPTGKLSAYTTATNYPSSSTYTYIEE